jgi:hypothetical protein
MGSSRRHQPPGGQPGSLSADIQEIREVARHRNYLCLAANHFFLLDTPAKEEELNRVEEAALDLCNRLITLVLPNFKNIAPKSAIRNHQKSQIKSDRGSSTGPVQPDNNSGHT